MASRPVRQPAGRRAGAGVGRGRRAERRLSHVEGSAEPRRLSRRAERCRAAGRRQDDRRSGPADGSHGVPRSVARCGGCRGDRSAGDQGARGHEELAGQPWQFVLAGRQTRDQKGAPSPALPRQVRRGSTRATDEFGTVECMTLLEIHEPGETPLPHAGEGSLAVGIDLGTTNSVVAIAREGKPAALHDETGRALVPSVVAYPEGGGVLVGDEARQLMASQPGNIVASVKRLMGRGAADLHAVAGVLPYEIEPGSGETDMVKLRVGGKARSPVEISADRKSTRLNSSHVK